MKCKFCEECRKRVYAALKHLNYDWEWWNSNEQDVWDSEDQAQTEIREQTVSLLEEDASEAFRQFEELQAAGSAIAARRLGWHFETGTHTSQDIHKAKEHYLAAWKAGSQLSGLDYERCCENLKEYGEARRVLNELISDGLVSAHYYLARLICYSEGLKGNHPSVVKHLEKAADGGHPNAVFWLGRIMLRGKLGLRNVPAGLRMILPLFSQLRKEM